MPSFPDQVLDGGQCVCFGQAIDLVEKAFGISAIDDPSSVARRGVDRKVRARNLALEFDAGRLRGIEFLKDYSFKTPPEPYSEAWKNFCSFGDNQIKTGMTRDEFITYIAAWEVRARELGAEKVESPDLQNDQFRFTFDKDQFTDMFHLAMGPSRRAGGGGIWADGWTAFFKLKDDLTVLDSISAACDVFNSVARRTDQA
jgi:hypothetical protein